jgi:PD-(D/E)XK endonuclease
MPMASTKRKGDLAELKVACDLVERGYRVAFPFGEDNDFDLILIRADDSLERIQVKHSKSNGAVLEVRCRSSSLTNGKVKRIKRYTAEMIDWIAVYDPITGDCFYIPAEELGLGRDSIYLRLVPTKNCQRLGIRYASDYTTLDRAERPGQLEMEPAGLEPAPFRMQTERSSN